MAVNPSSLRIEKYKERQNLFEVILQNMSEDLGVSRAKSVKLSAPLRDLLGSSIRGGRRPGTSNIRIHHFAPDTIVLQIVRDLVD